MGQTNSRLIGLYVQSWIHTFLFNVQVSQTTITNTTLTDYAQKDKSLLDKQLQMQAQNHEPIECRKFQLPSYNLKALAELFLCCLNAHFDSGGYIIANQLTSTGALAASVIFINVNSEKDLTCQAICIFTFLVRFLFFIFFSVAASVQQFSLSQIHYH